MYPSWQVVSGQDSVRWAAIWRAVSQSRMYAWGKTKPKILGMRLEYVCWQWQWLARRPPNLDVPST